MREEDGGFAIDLCNVVETIAGLQEMGYDTPYVCYRGGRID